MTDPRPYEPCPHDEPRGRHYCAVCRRDVLAAAGQWKPKPYAAPDPPCHRPMPPDFRERVRRAATTQPTLED